MGCWVRVVVRIRSLGLDGCCFLLCVGSWFEGVIGRCLFIVSLVGVFVSASDVVLRCL